MMALLLPALREALVLLLVCAAPPLLAAAVTSFLLQLLQARWTGPGVPVSPLPGLVAGLVVLALCAPWAGRELQRFLTTILLALPAIRP